MIVLSIHWAAAAEVGAKPASAALDSIPNAYKWNLEDIYPDWETWSHDKDKLQELMDQYAALKGTMAQSADRVLRAYQLGDEIGKLMHRVAQYPGLRFDLDQRDNAINARRQEVQILRAKFATASSWFDPELLAIPLDTMRQWLDDKPELALYRFAILDLYRQQEHVLNQESERLLSYFARFNGAPGDAYGSLTTADIQFPTVTLSTGEEVHLTPAQYQAVLATARNQADRRLAFQVYYQVYDANLNTYASLYNGILQRGWAYTQARKYHSTLDAALFGDNIPSSVVENLIAEVKKGTEPLRRYYDLRRRVLKLEAIDLYDGRVPLVDYDRKYEYDESVQHTVAAAAPLGEEYQRRLAQGLGSRWVDVYETEGKRSGGYSSGVYGIHPFVLMNYNDTVEELFTLAHEMGHSMHTVLAQESQPFIYSGYTIFVAEVASTMNEALLLDHLLKTSPDPKERVMLLQRAIDGIIGTFYTQVLFADFELQAHRLVEQGQPITAEVLNRLYYDLLKAYYGESAQLNELYRITWARIPHFYRSPYYVYQYATSYAASAQLARDILHGDAEQSSSAVERFLDLLRSGGSDYPMEQLKRAGVDLSRPEPVQAVVEQLDDLVSRLEAELAKL